MQQALGAFSERSLLKETPINQTECEDASLQDKNGFLLLITPGPPRVYHTHLGCVTEQGTYPLSCLVA